MLGTIADRAGQGSAARSLQIQCGHGGSALNLLAMATVGATVTHGSAARRRTLVALAAIAAGCSTTVRGGAPAGAPTIKKVVVEGNHGVSDKDIVSGLITRGPTGLPWRKTYRKLDRLAMEQDLTRIESFYQRRGYFSAEVFAPRVAPAGKEVKVTFRVKEGQPTRVSDLQIAGLPADLADAQPLREQERPLKVGATFRYDRYEQLKTWLVAWLANRGYPHAIVSGQVAVDRDARTAAVQLQVDVGPRAVFGETEIKGLRRVPRSAIENRLAYHVGDRFDPTHLELTQGRLYQLNLFSAVRIDYEREGRPPETGITISVAEAKRHEWRLGGGVGVEGGFDPNQTRLELRGRSDYLMRNFLHPLATLRVDLRPAYQFIMSESRYGPAGEALVSVDRADLLAPRLNGQAAVGYAGDKYEAYTQMGPLARLGLQRPFIHDRLLAGLTWRGRQLTFSEISPAIDETTRMEIGMVSPYRVSAVDENVALELRDNPIDPRRGFFAQVTASEGSEALGGTFTFTRATGDVRGYLPIGRRLVLAARAMYGRGLSGSLPVTERFFEGGANGHRGFVFRQLSPFRVGPEGEIAPIGGEEVGLTSGEVRFDLTKIRSYPFGVVAFADGGDVVESPGELDLANLHWASGLGLRFNPVVSLRLDVAYRLNRYGPGEPAPGHRFAFHFSLGQAF
jgi:translocation and assembly module TamA